MREVENHGPLVLRDGPFDLCGAAHDQRPWGNDHAFDEQTAGGDDRAREKAGADRPHHRAAERLRVDEAIDPVLRRDADRREDERRGREEDERLRSVDERREDEEPAPEERPGEMTGIENMLEVLERYERDFGDGSRRAQYDEDGDRKLEALRNTPDAPKSLAEALIAAEPDILAHMNDEHAAAVSLYATQLLGAPAASWRITGIDPEGADLLAANLSARLLFDKPLQTPADAHRALVDLARAARGASLTGWEGLT